MTVCAITMFNKSCYIRSYALNYYMVSGSNNGGDKFGKYSRYVIHKEHKSTDI